MSYVLDGVEAPTLEALDVALSHRRSRRGLGATRATSNKSKGDQVLAFVKANRPFVKRYLKKYGATDRGFSKGTTIVVGKHSTNLSVSSVDRANDPKLAAMLLATIVHDSVHALRIGTSVATGLGTLGEDVEQSSSGAQDNVALFKGIVDMVVAIGPSVMALFDMFSQQSKEPESAVKKVGRASSSSSSSSSALSPRETSPVVAASSGVHPAFFVLGALAVAGTIYWIMSNKKETV